MSYRRLVHALLTGQSYFGPALRTLQGVPSRHQYFLPVVNVVAQRKQGPITVLEVGSWGGASAISWAKAIRKLNRQGCITCVDHWRPYFDVTHESERHYVDMIEAAQSGDIYKVFLHNIKAEGVDDMVVAHIGDSQAVLEMLPVQSFDIVYIDGSHCFQDVLSDIKNAKRLIAECGIICGDDLELQKNEVGDVEHAQDVLTNQDYVYSSVAKASYHPGVTEAVAAEFKRVSVWDGFWATGRWSGEWGEVELNLTNIEIPSHLVGALNYGACKVFEETSGFNLVESEGRYWAIAKALGPTVLFEERLGDRELAPLLFTGETLEEIKKKVAKCEAEAARPAVKLVESTSQFNLVESEGRYWAIAKALGPTVLFEERLGDRELAPLLFTGETLEEIKKKVASCQDIRPC